MAIAVTAATGATLARQPAQRSDGLPLTLENIFRGGRGGAGNPTISPDGKWVTFTGRTARGNGLHRLSPTGGGEPELWAEAGGIEWAPDSQSVVFARGDRLWKLGLNEKQATAITPAVKGMRGPVFSPDGRTIAFSATGERPSGCLARTGGRRRAAPAHQGSDVAEDDGRFDPAWSPDGRTIAFISNKARLLVRRSLGRGRRERRRAAADEGSDQHRIDCAVVAEGRSHRALRQREEGLLVSRHRRHLPRRSEDAARRRR